MIETYSGAHPYRPQCVTAAARSAYTSWGVSQDYDLTAEAMQRLINEFAVTDTERITKAVDSRICPRCSSPLLADVPPKGWKPAGSRAIACRCVPVCEDCAHWIEPVLGSLSVSAWPTDLMEHTDDGEYDGTQKDYETAAVVRMKAAAEAVTAEVGSGSTGPVLISEAGIAEIQLRPHPGGWLEFGYTDDADKQERAR